MGDRSMSMALTDLYDTPGGRNLLEGGAGRDTVSACNAPAWRNAA